MTFQQFLLILRPRVGVPAPSSWWWAPRWPLSLLLPRSNTPPKTALVVDAKSADPLMGRMLPAQMIPGYMAAGGHHQLHARRPAGGRPAQRWTSRRSSRTMARSNTDPGLDQDMAGRAADKKLDVQPSRESSMLTIGYGRRPAVYRSRSQRLGLSLHRHQPRAQVEPPGNYAKWFDSQNAALRRPRSRPKRLSDYQQKQGIVATDDRLDENARLAEASRPSSRWLSGAEGEQPLAPGANRQHNNLPGSPRTACIQSLRPISCARKASATSSPAASANHPRSPAAMPKSPTCADASPPKPPRGELARHHQPCQHVARIRDQGRPRSPEAASSPSRPSATRSPCCSATSKTPSAPTTSSPSASPRPTSSQTQQTNVVVLTPAVARSNPPAPGAAQHRAGRVPRWPARARRGAAARAHGPARAREEDLAQITGMPVLGVIPGSA